MRAGARVMSLVVCFALLTGAAPSGAQGGKRLLFLTHSAGFKHSVIPLAEKIMPEIGEKLGRFQTTVSQDCSLISASELRNYDAVMFYTTGELPVPPEGRQALLEFVRSGKGFVGVHCATDTFYQWADYGEMIGGYFDGHPWHTDVVVRVEDTKFPATSHLGPAFRIRDEIYQHRNWSRSRTRVLLTLDTSSVDMNAKGIKRTDGDFALAWCHPYGQGRVFYSALGHREEVWQDERFQRFLVNGALWAMSGSGKQQ